MDIYVCKLKKGWLSLSLIHYNMNRYNDSDILEASLFLLPKYRLAVKPWIGQKHQLLMTQDDLWIIIKCITIRIAYRCICITHTSFQFYSTIGMIAPVKLQFILPLYCFCISFFILFSI